MGAASANTLLMMMMMMTMAVEMVKSQAVSTVGVSGKLGQLLATFKYTILPVSIPTTRIVNKKQIIFNYKQIDHTFFNIILSKIHNKLDQKKSGNF